MPTDAERSVTAPAKLQVPETSYVVVPVLRFPWAFEELETLPMGTKPRTPHRRLPGRQRRGQRRRSVIDLQRTGKSHRQSDQRGEFEIKHWRNF